MPSAESTSFDQLRPALSAVAGIQPDALEEAASALAAASSTAIYEVMPTEQGLRRLGLSE